MMTPTLRTKTETTPGPWKLVKRDTTFEIVGADGVLVLKTSWHNSIRDPYPLKDEAWKNAQLATAAPELLAALGKTLDRLESALEHVTRTVADDQAIDMARRAIAKAEGRT